VDADTVRGEVLDGDVRPRGAGLIAPAATVRPTAARAITALKALGIEPVMMTGAIGA